MPRRRAAVLANSQKISNAIQSLAQHGFQVTIYQAGSQHPIWACTVMISQRLGTSAFALQRLLFCTPLL
jgi:hypothetical protein